MSAVATERLTPEEYIALEDVTPYRSEYYDGAMVFMEDRTIANSTINVNFLGELHTRLRGSPWTVLSSGMRVLIESVPLYTYPDGMVTPWPPGQRHIVRQV